MINGWKIYNKIKIPLIVILIIVFIATMLIPKTIIVECWDGSEIEVEEFNEDWITLCPDVPSPFGFDSLPVGDPMLPSTFE